MRTAPLLAATLAVLTACATEVKAPTASVVATLSVNSGAVVQLDGSASSDPAGRALGYDWSFTALPAGSRAALNDATIARPSFVADVPGDYMLQLVVSNGVHPSPPAAVTVTASTCGTARPNAQVQLLAPEAAGPGAAVGAIRIPVGATVSASGAASSDPDNAPPCSAGQPLSYRWSLDAIPAGSTAVLTSATAVTPSFVANVPGAYRLGLVVTDATGLASSGATLTVTADPSFGAVLPLPGFSIQTVNAGAAQAMNAPRGLAVDATGAVYVAQSAAPRRVTKHQAGGVSILAEGAYLATALSDVALDDSGASPRLLVTSGPRIVAVDPTTGLQSLFADFSFGGGGQSLQGIAVGVTATTPIPSTSTWRVAVADRNNSQILLFDPAAAALPLTAPTATVPFGGTLQNPWGVAMISPVPSAAAGTAVWFSTSNASGSIEKLDGVTTSTLLSNGGSLVLDGARDLALSPCPSPRLFVANGTSVLVVDPATPGAFRTLVTGLGAAAGLAFDASGATPALLVTDDSTRSALYRIDGPFCTL